MRAIFNILLLIILTSCSSHYHYLKFIKKGGSINDKLVEVRIADTLRINGKDSIIFNKIEIPCPEPSIPLTKTEIRWKYKLKRDSIDVVKYQIKYKIKKVKKGKNWFIEGIAFGIVISVWIRIMYNKYKKR